MQDDPYAERKLLTFAQAEGAEPLPQQLALKEISRELRAKLWSIVHESLVQNRKYYDWITYRKGSYLEEPWRTILYRKHVMRDHRMADDFDNSFEDLSAALRQIFERGNYVQIFDFLQWLLRQRERTINWRSVQAALEDSCAAYRLLDDGRTIVPIASENERQTISRAFADLASSEFDGARTHLEAAAEQLTLGNSAGSIRESISAVESVARSLGGTKSLSGALQRLKDKRAIHPALERGFNSIYGFTSDEKGIRHPLLEESTAKVDEADAVFMIGACAAFVSYLINRTRTEAP
jgi:AbiJ N-terminal domain 4